MLLAIPALALGCAESTSQPTALVTGSGSGRITAASHGNSQGAHLCQKGGYQTLHSAATGLVFSSEDDCVSYGSNGGAYSSLVVSTAVVDAGFGPQWGAVSGFGLGSDVQFTEDGVSTVVGATKGGLNTGFTAPDGTLSSNAVVFCGNGYFNVNAVSTTSLGAPITSNVIATSPCG